jgi:phospholipase C
MRWTALAQSPAAPCRMTQAARRPDPSSDSRGDKSLPFRPITRREVLKLTSTTAVSGLASALVSSCGSGGGPVGGGPGPSTCAKLSDIEHVVIFIQENRSFDHYFGSYRGVRDLFRSEHGIQQPDPAIRRSPPGWLLPFT